MHNFKSFRRASIGFPTNFVCFIGPNGSGKSNICDAIRFAFGEMSLKTLRARSFKDLIHHGSNSTTVSVVLDVDGKKYEVKRSINTEKKIEYYLNKKKTTRAAILSFLEQHNLDNSNRNVVGQGEVEKIINLNPKDRRGVIDSVAGIAAFEDKKKEALRNLELVEQRIRETSVLLGEKLSTLERLKREKEEAQQYEEAQKTYHNAKASLLELRKKKIETELSQVEDKKAALEKKKASLEGEIKALNSQIDELETKVDMGELKTLNAALQSTVSEIHETELMLERLRAAKQQKSEALRGLKAQIDEIEQRLSHLAKEKERATTRLEEIEREAGEIVLPENEPSFNLEEVEHRLEQLKEEKHTYEKRVAEIRSKMELLKERLDEVSEEEEVKDTAQTEAEVSRLKKKIMSLFEDEKTINQELKNVEREMVSLREDIASLRAQNPRMSLSRVVEYINALKREIDGIHGPLIDLISFPPTYTKAIESAVGSRLLYIVVDDVDVATKIIERLKKAKVGRATFIPLREVKATAPNPGSHVLLSSVVDYPPEIEKAIWYAFGSTIVVKNIAEARSIGVGTRRMVTLDGDLFEQSGIITGGALRTGIAAASTIAKLEKQLSELKDKKVSLLRRIEDIRKAMNEVRSKKIELEVELKNAQAIEQKRAEIESKKKQIAKELKDLSEELKGLEVKINEVNGRINRFVEEREHLIKQQQEAMENTKKKYGEQMARRSALLKEKEIIKEELKQNARATENAAEQLKECKASRNKLEKELRTLEIQVKDLEEKNASLEKKRKELMDQMAACNEQSEELTNKLRSLGKQRATLRHEVEQVKQSLHTLELSAASLKTKYNDMVAELNEVGEYEFLELGEKDLMEKMNNSRAFLNEHRNVNLAAVELYDEKKAEVGDVQERIEQLKKEKRSILDFLAEIERKKEDAFFSIFYKVADKFKEMYRQTGLDGEGNLFLDKPSKVFESGLHIRVKRDGKEIDLLSLSGGERALLALAFLFSLEAVKSSPFYVLDEIDSSLDPKNSRQIGEFINRLSKNTQFIVVSHREHMVACADVVYGVARKGTASTVVGIRLDGKQN